MIIIKTSIVRSLKMAISVSAAAAGLNAKHAIAIAIAIAVAATHRLHRPVVEHNDLIRVRQLLLQKFHLRARTREMREKDMCILDILLCMMHRRTQPQGQILLKQGYVIILMSLLRYILPKQSLRKTKTM